MKHFDLALMGLAVLMAMPVIATGAIVEPRVDRFDSTHVIVSWSDAVPVDIYLTDHPDDMPVKAALLSESNSDGLRWVTVSAGIRPYFVLRDRADGETIRVSERQLPLERGSNFRDVGGYAGAAGKHIRWGMIYRSGATPVLSDRDVAYVRKLGLVSMIDLRSSDERMLAPTRLGGQGIHYIAIDYSFRDAPRSYEQALTTLAPQFQAIFGDLLSAKGPISYNCTAGQDRTGIATALILSALGVSRQTILKDYHLSTVYRHPKNEMRAINPAEFPHNQAALLLARARLEDPWPLYSTTGRSLLAEMFDVLDARWGNVENYLDKMLGVGPTEIERLRALYLE